MDAMQDVFVELVKRRPGLSDRAPASLCHQVATHVCLNRLRTERRHPEDRDEELLLAIADAREGAEATSSARSVLSRIFGAEPESSRTLAVMHLVDGMTLEEVAAEVGLSVSGVRKRLRRLKARVVELEGV